MPGVDTRQALYVVPYGDGPAVVTNSGQTTIYYSASTPLVSATVNDGSLTAGATLTVSQGTWLLSSAAGGYVSLTDGGTGALADPGGVNTVRNRVQVTPVAAAENAVVVKAPNSSWGDETVIPYGNGQAFLLLKEDTAGAVLPDDLVLYRVNRNGDIGTGGGMHIATGLRQRPGFTATQAVWVNPQQDMIGLVLEAATATPTQSYLQAETGGATPTTVFEIKGTGKVEYNAPQARVSNSAAISIANSAATILTFNTNVFDTAGIHSTTTNTDRLTAPVAGVYLITGHVEWAANATGVRQLYTTISTGGTLAAQLGPSAGAIVTQQSVSTVVQLAAGQYVQLVGFQNSGGALNVDTNTASPVFTMAYLGRGQ